MVATILSPVEVVIHLDRLDWFELLILKILYRDLGLIANIMKLVDHDLVTQDNPVSFMAKLRIYIYLYASQRCSYSLHLGSNTFFRKK